MKRHESREASFLLTFEAMMTGQSAEETLAIADECESQEDGLFEIDDRARQVFIGICAQRTELDEQIQAHLTRWKVDRISKVAHAALLLALYEMHNCDDVEDDVAISEAVKLTEAYALKEEVSFVNGVLAAVAKERRA